MSDISSLTMGDIFSGVLKSSFNLGDYHSPDDFFTAIHFFILCTANDSLTGTGSDWLDGNDLVFVLSVTDAILPC